MTQVEITERLKAFALLFNAITNEDKHIGGKFLLSGCNELSHELAKAAKVFIERHCYGNN